MPDEPVCDDLRESRDLTEQPVAAGADVAVGITRVAQAYRSGHGGQVKQIIGAETGEPVSAGLRCRSGWIRPVIAEQQCSLPPGARSELVELQPQQPRISAQLDQAARYLVGHPADELELLSDDRDVGDGCPVLDLHGGESTSRVRQAQLVALERGELLVRSSQQRGRVLQHVPFPSGKNGNRPHRLADGDDRETGLPGGTLRRPVAGTGLLRRQCRVGHELHGGSQDPAGFRVEHDSPVHLRQLAKPGGGELSVKLEASRADPPDDRVRAHHNQCAGVPTDNAIQAIPECGSRRNHRQRRAPPLIPADAH